MGVRPGKERQFLVWLLVMTAAAVALSLAAVRDPDGTGRRGIPLKVLAPVMVLCLIGMWGTYVNHYRKGKHKQRP